MLLVTFHACCIASNKRKDGTYPVKIRVTFKGASRRLPTNLVARPGDLTRTLHIKSPGITARANALIARMQDTLADISPLSMEAWDVDRVVAHIRTGLAGMTFRLDFFAWADTYLACKTATTRRAYDMALNALERFLGARELDINDITRAKLLDFVAFINDEPKMHYDPRSGEWKETGRAKRTGAASRHLMKLQHMFDAAKFKYNDDDRILIPRSPFAGIPRDYGHAEGEEALPVEVLQRMILDTAPEGVERVAVDAFLLSFATMGANLADLYAARRFQGDKWSYKRKKTGAPMRLTVPPEVSGIVGRLRRGGGEWWLPELHRIASTGANQCTAKINAALHRWAARAGVPRFNFYAARHTWASVARNKAGIEKATVDECLTHKGDFPLADIYIQRSWDRLDAANRKVLELLEWPE